MTAGVVDGAALMKAHGATAYEVAHDAEGKIIVNEDGSHPKASPIVPMVDAETATHKRHGGRIGPIPRPFQGPAR